MARVISTWRSARRDHYQLQHNEAAALSFLGYEHHLEEPAIRLWNDNHRVLEEHAEAIYAKTPCMKAPPTKTRSVQDILKQYGQGLGVTFPTYPHAAAVVPLRAVDSGGCDRRRRTS
jgi:hypothetical protein